MAVLGGESCGWWSEGSVLAVYREGSVMRLLRGECHTQHTHTHTQGAGTLGDPHRYFVPDDTYQEGSLVPWVNPNAHLAHRLHAQSQDAQSRAHSSASPSGRLLMAQVCCSVLQCVAVCCSVLQCVCLLMAQVCCSVLQCVGLLMVQVCYSVLQCVAMCVSPHGSGPSIPSVFCSLFQRVAMY